jgi:uncharacterized protein YdcH (DUF465 family)
MTKQAEIALHLSSEINSRKSAEIVKKLKNNHERFAIICMRPNGLMKRIVIMDYEEERNDQVDEIIQNLKAGQFLFVVRYKKHVCFMIVNT